MLIVSLLMLVLLQRHLIYQPTREPVVHAMAGATADRLTDVSIVTSDGVTLKGWHVAARTAGQSGGAAPADHAPRRLTIYFQGNAVHRGRRGKQFTMLSNLGSDVLIVDYRGYGESGGRPSEQGLALDACAIWKHAIEELGFTADQIVLFGESLGGGVATGLAAELCEQGVVPGGLILRATFASLVDTARHHYPWLPVSWLLIDRYPSIDRLPRINCPLLVLHGDQDQIIPFAHSERLYAAAPERSANGVPKMFVPLPGAGHNDILYVAAERVEGALTEFFARLP